MDKSKFKKVRKTVSKSLEDSIRIKEKYIHLGAAISEMNKNLWTIDVYINRDDREVLLEFMEDGEYFISKTDTEKRFGGQRIARIMRGLVGEIPQVTAVDKHAVLLTRRV